MTTTTCEKHEFQVIDAVYSTLSLNVQCSNCAERGVVSDPTAEEWARAFHAPDRPYRWDDDDRVRLLPNGCNAATPPHMSEALDLLWEWVEGGKPAPTEIEVEVEDDNTITWSVDGLLKAAGACSDLLTHAQCEQYGLAVGSSYGDLSEQISRAMTCLQESGFEILETRPARFPKHKQEPPPQEERTIVISDDMRSANARKEGKNFLVEPVHRDGKATGEWRVYRFSIPRTFCLVPSSKIPWHAVLPSKEAMDGWVERVLNEQKE